MLERWEFIQFPCTKDPNRYKLKVKATEDDLNKILRMLNCNSGRSFASLSHEYNWGVYFYGVSLEERNRIIEVLKKMCDKGAIAQSDITMAQELSPMFEEFLEATAKELKDENFGEQEQPALTETEHTEPQNLEIETMRETAPPPPPKPIEAKKEEKPAEAEPLEIVPNISRQFFEEEQSAPSPAQPQMAGIQKDDRSMFDKNIELETRDVKDIEGVEIFSSHEMPQVTPPPPPAIEAAEQKIPEAPNKNDNDLKNELNPRYTMKEFIVGSNNRFTHAAAKAVAENPGKIYNPLFIYGGVGLGKTHLMHAVGHYVLEKNPQAVILCVTTEKFMSEVIEAIGKGTLQELREKYRKIDVLLIDDIQFLSESESTQEEFFHTFNMLHESGKQIIITSDRPPKLLTTLEDRLRSRFEWGLIADIKSPTLETRIAILKKKNEGGTINLNDNMLLYIASKLKSNIRELEGFLKRINAYAALTGQEVSMDLVRSIMSELLPEEEMQDEVLEDKKNTGIPAPSPVKAETIVSQVKQPEVMPGIQPISPPPPPQVKPPVISKPPPAPANLPPKPPSAPVPPPKPAAAPKLQPAPQPAAASSKEDVDTSLTPVEVAFFYPQGKDNEFNMMKEKFSQVIKKHKLKFRFESVFERTYDHSGKINYAFFTELCKTNNIRIVVVLGIPQNPTVANDDFASLLGAMMEDEKISMQYVPWAELSKDYRYLNLALDITLLRNKKHEA